MDLQIPTKRIASEEASKHPKKQRQTKKWTPSDGEGSSLDATTWLLYDPSEIPIITPDDYRDSSGTKGLPGYVILGDRALSTVIMAGVGREERGKLWPLDFTAGGDVRPDRVRACEAAMDDTWSIYEVRAADGTKILLKGSLPLDKARKFPTRRLVPTSRPPTPVQPLTAISVHNAVHPMSPSGTRSAEPLHVTTPCIIESCPSTTQLKEGQPSVEQQLPTSRFTTSGKSPLASQADVEERPATGGKSLPPSTSGKSLPPPMSERSLPPPMSERSLLNAARERPARGHSVEYYKRQLKAKSQLTEEERDISRVHYQNQLRRSEHARKLEKRSFQRAAKLMQAMLFRTCQELDRSIDEGRRVANSQSNFIAGLEYLLNERAVSDENILRLLVDIRNIHGESPANNARIELRRCETWLRYELPESMKALPVGRHNLPFPKHQFINVEELITGPAAESNEQSPPLMTQMERRRQHAKWRRRASKSTTTIPGAFSYLPVSGEGDRYDMTDEEWIDSDDGENEEEGGAGDDSDNGEDEEEGGDGDDSDDGEDEKQGRWDNSDDRDDGEDANEDKPESVAEEDSDGYRRWGPGYVAQ